MFPVMTLARRTALLAAVAGTAGLVTACGTAASPGAAPTKTITTTVPATSASSPAPSSSPSAAAGSGTTTTAPSGPGPCVSADLQASLGQAGAAAGTFYHLIVLTNTSGGACTLYGYPGVSFVTGQGGSVIGAPATRNPLISDTLVTLSPGGTASALIGIADTGNLPPSACETGTADWLQIYPPGDYGAVYLQLTSSVCTRPGQRFMTVTAVHAGSIDSY
jgi:hypothetical protein